jgi:cytochrome c-L
MSADMRSPSISQAAALFAIIAAVHFIPHPAQSQEIFRHTITGEDLKVMETSEEKGRDTEAVKIFMNSGVNPYTEVKNCLPKGEEVYLSACSGCHGHLAEGKVGPGLNDSYWTYPKNKTDKGLFETIYGGANGMMGPHSDLELDEILTMMAWIRHLYTGPTEDADWLTVEQKKVFKPYAEETHAMGGAGGGGATGTQGAAAPKCEVPKK